MDSIGGGVGLLSIALDVTLHNYPVLEAAVILPLLLKAYRWVILGCVGVVLLTFGVQKHAGTPLGMTLSAANLMIISVQIAIVAALSWALFLAKGAALKAFRISDTPDDKA